MNDDFELAAGEAGEVIHRTLHAAHLEFALGKALEDEGAWEESFRHYDQGNRMRRAGKLYDPEQTTAHVRRSRALFTPEFFASRRGYGAPAADDLHRRAAALGSTCANKFSQPFPVEGPWNCRHRRQPVHWAAAEPDDISKYPEILGTLSAADCQALGEQYLQQTRIQRKSAAPFFIDKMPNNFAHVGLIHLALPNAKIIDARRHPLGCCFSGFKQHFARGQNFTYSLQNIAAITTLRRVVAFVWCCPGGCIGFYTSA
jgi:hypothetical protein